MGLNWLVTKQNINGSRELILTHVLERFRLETERKNDLDGKANNFAGFVGIIFSLVSGFGITSFSSFTWPDYQFSLEYIWKISPIILFTLVYVALIIAVFFILKAMNIKAYIYVPQPFNLIGIYENNNKIEEITQALYDEYALAIDKNMQQNNKEALDIKKAINCFFSALVLFAIAVILMALQGWR